MRTINLQQELKFIHFEKIHVYNKENLQFKLLNIAQTIISNYINTKKIKMKAFYKMIYDKNKKFYLRQYRE